jgi:hypothetical protein
VSDPRLARMAMEWMDSPRTACVDVLAMLYRVQGEERDRCAAILRSVMPTTFGSGVRRKSWEKAFREALRQIEKKEAD